MKVKQKKLIFGLLVIYTIATLFLGQTTPASAVSCTNVETSVIGCDQTGGGDGVCPDGSIVTKDQIENGALCSDGSKPDVVANSGIWGILMLVINIMSAGIGVLAVGGIAYGSVMYASAGGNPEKSKKARLMITNVVVGLLMYILMFALLNYIVPGGLFRAATP